MRYLVMLHEPSTNHARPASFDEGLFNAKRSAMRCVDDATRTEGHVFDLYHLPPRRIGYAYLDGDGGTEWKDVQ